MRQASDLFRSSALAAALLSLSACGAGGGASSDPAGLAAGSGSSKSITASGTITGFSSVYVNGVRYDTSNAQVELNGDGAGSEADLRLGMKVLIEASGQGDELRADRIEYDRDLKGPVSGVTPNPDDNRIGAFSVLEQLVVVDANTVFDDNVGDVDGDGSIDIRDLAPAGAPVVVEVSGFPIDNGFLATRIEREDPADADGDAEVTGFVTDLVSDAGTFSIGALTITFDAADLDTADFPDGKLSNDVFVEVEGAVSGPGALDATRISRDSDFDSSEAREGDYEIEGILQAVDTTADPDTVTIDGNVIQVNDASSLVGLEGSRVEIEGSFNAAGVLVLRAGDDGIMIEAENSVRVDDRIETVGVDSFTTRLGLVIMPTGNSRNQDEADQDGDHLTPAQFLARVAVGDFIEARGYPDTDGTVIWTRIARTDQDGLACGLQGPVATGSISNPTFAIQGVTIDTSAVSGADGFHDADGNETDRDGFFTVLAEGDVVGAHSTDGASACTGGQLMAREVQFELDDEVFGSESSSDDGESENDDD